MIWKLKNITTFVAFLQGTKFLTFACVVFFISTNTALNAVEIGLSISDGYYAERSVIVPCRTEKDSLSSFINFNFSFMQGTMKNVSKANNSILTNTSTHDTGNPTEKQYDFSKFQEYFSSEISPAALIALLEEMRREYLELSFYVACVWDNMNIPKRYPNENALMHSETIEYLIKAVKTV